MKEDVIVVCWWHFPGFLVLEMASLSEYIAEQDALEQQARQCMPYDPDECTYATGSLRQELYACQTCYRETGKPNAICYACSIKCHTSHDLVELFTKRGRTCDCGTSRIVGPCIVRYPNWSNLLLDSKMKKEFEPDIPDSNNKYGHNFKGLFCSCNTPYNPLTDSNMLQCILGVQCDEDWYHEECIMGLRPGVIDRSSKKSGINRLAELSEPGLDASEEQKTSKDDHDDNGGADDNDSDSDDDDEILPLTGFPSLDSFEFIICWKCVSKFPAEMAELQKLLNPVSVDYVRADSIDHRLNILHPNTENEDNSKRAKKDYPKTLFLKEDFKEILKIHKKEEPNTKLSEFLDNYKFMYEDDPIFRPPEDDDVSSTFELGIKELKHFPNDKAAQGLAAYDKIKSKLTEFLKPFAQNGKIVTEDEVKEFFKFNMKEQ